MRFIDIQCTACGAQTIDHFQRSRDETIAPCPACNGARQRVYLPSAQAAVIGDEIPGGVEIEHGLCNADGSPRRYFSKSEIAREAAKRGLVNHVVHVGTKGGDKSKHTTRWT